MVALTRLRDTCDVHPLHVSHVAEHAEDDEAGVETGQRVAEAHEDRVPDNTRETVNGRHPSTCCPIVGFLADV